jgi:hypothetical protein
MAADHTIATFRRDIVDARIKLAATDLTADQKRELWQIIDSREWFIKRLSGSYEAELEQIDRALEEALRR